MIPDIDICRLVEKNKEIIIELFKQAGYEYMLAIDKSIIEIFADCEDFVFSDIALCTDKKGVLLCLKQNESVLEAEKHLENLKVHVLSTEYSRMLRQLALVTEESIQAYKALFGYSAIVCDGVGECFEQLKALNHNTHSGDDTNTLYITEYIDNGTAYEFKHENTLGIRQFLYELEVLATFPVEIKEKLTNTVGLEKYLFRFCEIFTDTGWDILFSEKTPVSEKLMYDNNKYNISYIDDYTAEEKTSKKIIIIENGNVLGTRKFYSANRTARWRVVRRFIVLFRTWIMEELCKYFKKVLGQKGVKLQLVNWNWAMNHPLFPKEDFTCIDTETREKINLYNIRSNISSYEEFLKEVYKGDYSRDYAGEVMDIPNKIQLLPGKIRHENKKSRYINVVNGERYTEGQPENSRNSIYMLGGCVFFGYAVEDAHTISSYLQDSINKRLGEEQWKVVNMGTWGGNIDQTYKTIYDLKFRPGDVVLVSYAGYMPLGEDYKSWDISTVLNSGQLNENSYFNSVIHCGSVGYRLVGSRIYSLLESELKSENETGGEFYLENPEADDAQDKMYSEQADEYLKTVRDATPLSWKKGVYGAIVMNCNPFTLGHRYLIEQSSRKVDYLYIFVVEGIPNVVVVPSGKLIISSVTFPGYFLKDSPDCVSVDTSLDVDIFARFIASPLNITKRFVGEEPLDMVTRSYNESMKEILPRYGIMVDEIPRKEEQGDVISASRVRRALKTGDFKTISSLVPDTTLNYLLERKERSLERSD